MYAVLKLNDKCSEPFLSPISIFSWLKGNVNCTPLHKYRVIHQVMGKGFVKYFLRVPLAVGLYCSCNAAQASKGNFQKTFYKTFPMT